MGSPKFCGVWLSWGLLGGCFSGVAQWGLAVGLLRGVYT